MHHKATEVAYPPPKFCGTRVTILPVVCARMTDWLDIIQRDEVEAKNPQSNRQLKPRLSLCQVRFSRSSKIDFYSAQHLTVPKEVLSKDRHGAHVVEQT